MGSALHTKGNTPGVGVTSAEEARLADGGLLAVGSGGLVSTRTGVLVGPGATALVTGTSSTGTMRYSVAAHHWVTNRGVVSDGVYRGAAETAKLVDTTAAPGTGSRIDIVWVKQNDAGSTIAADATSVPVYGCTQGTSSTGTPSPPTIPTGAEELARATVLAGATRTDDGTKVTISQTARITVARGAPVPVRSKTERDGLDKYVGLTVIRLDMAGREQRYTGTYWADPSDVPVLASIAARDAYFAGELRAGAQAMVGDEPHVYDGTAWRFWLTGTVSMTVDGSTAIGTFPHGGGQVPRRFHVQVRGQQTDALAAVLKLITWAQDATNLQVRAIRTDTSQYFPGTPVDFFWFARF